MSMFAILVLWCAICANSPGRTAYVSLGMFSLLGLILSHQMFSMLVRRFNVKGIFLGSALGILPAILMLISVPFVADLTPSLKSGIQMVISERTVSGREMLLLWVIPTALFEELYFRGILRQNGYGKASALFIYVCAQFCLGDVLVAVLAFVMGIYWTLVGDKFGVQIAMLSHLLFTPLFLWGLPDMMST